MINRVCANIRDGAIAALFIFAALLCLVVVVAVLLLFWNVPWLLPVLILTGGFLYILGVVANRVVNKT